MSVVWRGRVDYRAMLADQLAERERVWAGAPGTIFLCEHPPVITLGRSADRRNVLAPGDLPVEQTERGGDVTYHGPGQLMVYPVLRIGPRGVVDFLARIAGALSDACAALDVPGALWRRDPAGLWLGDAKLAACGVHVARGVAVHGWALNVATPPDAWQRIRACGLGAPQVSLAQVRGGQPPEVEAVAIAVGPRVQTVLL
jgi:lipoate-protein ligase B